MGMSNEPFERECKHIHIKEHHTHTPREDVYPDKMYTPVLYWSFLRGHMT
jgi:hypothetical protein